VEKPFSFILPMLYQPPGEAPNLSLIFF